MADSYFHQTEIHMDQNLMIMSGVQSHIYFLEVVWTINFNKFWKSMGNLRNEPPKENWKCFSFTFTQILFIWDIIKHGY